MTSKRASIAKVSRPRLFGAVARERLFARLDENRGRPLLWIEGPPGAGKTTLVASYVEAREIPVLWYQFDQAEADPAGLFHYLTLAAAALLEAEALLLPRLAPEHSSDLPGFARAFFRALFASLPPGVVLVLDNYQETRAESALHDVVLAATSSVPRESSIIAISREPAPAIFAHVSAQGSLGALRWESLKLTLDETRAICAAREVRADWLIQSFHAQSEGWPAGLILMLERIEHHRVDEGTLRADTLESVFDYFASLIVARLDPSTHRVLLSLGFVPYLSIAMAVTISGSAGAGEILEELYRRRLFTDRRLDSEPVFQFHALFRDFLQRRARETFGPDVCRELTLRSADALVGHGAIDAAIDLYVATANWEKVEVLILESGKSLLESGRWQTLERWCERLPPDVCARNPRLLYWQGMARLHFNARAGLDTLIAARKAFGECADKDGRMLVLAALIHAGQLGNAALEVVDESLGALLDETQAEDFFPSADVALSIWSAIGVGLIYFRPWNPLVFEARKRVQALLSKETDLTLALVTASTTLLGDSESGHLEMANELITWMEPLLRRPEASPSAKATFFFAMGHIRFLEGRYEQSLESFDAAQYAASMSGLHESLSVIELNRVLVEFRARGWAEASRVLDKYEAHPAPKRGYLMALLRIYQARRAHAQGLHAVAAEHAALCLATAESLGSPQLLAQHDMFASDIYLGSGRPDLARPLLSRARALIDRTPVMEGWRAPLTMGEAGLAYADGREEESIDALRHSLTLVRSGPGHCFLRFMDCCMRTMFCFALDRSIEIEAIQQVIRAYRLKPPRGAPDLWPRPIRIHTLGRFSVHLDDRPLEFTRKSPKKTLGLLKALIAHGGDEVPESWLCDALWGDEEADSAQLVLSVTVSRLRKLLGRDDAIVQRGGNVWLDRELCWVDCWRFQATLSEPSRVDKHKGALEHYHGAFLPDDEGAPWSVPMREKLRGRLIHALADVGNALEREGRMNDAAALYLRGIDADAVVEVFHRGLMRCYARMGKYTEAVSAYRRLRQMLSAVLGIAPSEESNELYQEIMHRLRADGQVCRIASD